MPLENNRGCLSQVAAFPAFSSSSLLLSSLELSDTEVYEP